MLLMVSSASVVAGGDEGCVMVVHDYTNRLHFTNNNNNNDDDDDDDDDNNNNNKHW